MSLREPLPHHEALVFLLQLFKYRLLKHSWFSDKILPHTRLKIKSQGLNKALCNPNQSNQEKTSQELNLVALTAINFILGG